MRPLSAESLAARKTELQAAIAQNDRERKVAVTKRDMLTGALLEIERLIAEGE